MSSFKLTTFICPFCTVRITSGGVSGWGEAGQYGPPEPVASAIKVRRGEANSGLYSSFSTQDVLAKRIIGEEIQPTVISDMLYSFSRDFGQRGTYVEAISGERERERERVLRVKSQHCHRPGIDVALWDLLGKKLGAPVCKLLGGNFRDRVKVYATGCYYRHDHHDPACISTEESIRACAEEAKSFRDAGFTAVKMKVGLLSVADDLKRVQAAREAIGKVNTIGRLRSGMNLTL